MRISSHARLVCALLPLALCGCGSGTAAIVSGTGGGGSSNVKPAQIESVAVRNVKGPTCDIDYVLGGEQSSSQLRIGWFKPNTDPVLIASPVQSPKAYTLADWDFFTALNLPKGELSKNVTVFVVLAKDFSSNKANLQQKLNVDNSVTVALGNEAPEVALDNTQFLNREFSGVLPFTFRVSDSSSESVDITVWYRSEQVPGWTKATAFNAKPSEPGNPFTLVALDQGTPVTFAWVTDADLLHQDQRVQLLVTAEETFPVECPAPRGEELSVEFRVDNNTVPTAAIDFLGVFVNPDVRRGMPFPVDVTDDLDAVDLVFQWRFNDGTFPSLTGLTLCQLRRAMQDPRSRRALQLATERPFAHEGRLLAAASPDQARLPELATSASELLAKYPSPVTSMLGRRLEVLRPSRALVTVSQAWSAPLTLPASVEALASGATVLVLEELGTTSWRLRELRAADGTSGGVLDTPPECLPPVAMPPPPPTPFKPCPNPLAASPDSPAQPPESATGQEFDVTVIDDGRPTALALSVDGGSALVATLTRAGDWRIHGVDLFARTTTLLAERPPTLPPGELRDLLQLEAGHVIATQGTALLRIDLPKTASATANIQELVQLGEPVGLAADPTDPASVFVADRAADLVLHVNTRNLVAYPLVGFGPKFVRPSAIAVDRPLNRLLVLTSEAAAGTHELRSLSLGRADAKVIELMNGIPASATGLCAGDDAFAAFVVRDQGALWAGGGVEQLRTVVGYDPATQTVTVDVPFLPSLSSTVFAKKARGWRIRDLVAPFHSQAGTRGTFVWDSTDVGGSRDDNAQEVLLRALAFDSDLGPMSPEVPHEVTAPQKTDALGPMSVPQTPTMTKRTFADFDGDGDIDVMSPNAGNLDILSQVTPGRFVPSPNPVLGVPGLDAAADVDADGLVDLITGPAIRFQDPLHPGQFGPPQLYMPAGMSRAIAVGDLDGNGRLDIFAQRPFIGIELYQQDLAGVFTKNPLTLITNIFPVRQAAVADMNGDGRGDLVLGADDTLAPAGKWRKIGLFLQRPDGGFDALPNRELQPLDVPEFTSFAVGDVLKDGITDLVATVVRTPVGQPVKGSNAQYFANPGAGGSSTPSLHGSLLTTPEPTDVVLTDMDEDADLDVVVASSDVTGGEPAVLVFYQSGGKLPQFPSETLAEVPVHWIHVLDVDGDARLDLVADELGSLLVHPREKPGRWVPPIEDPLGFSPSGWSDVALADFDRDGDLDVAGQVSGLRAIEVFFQSRPGGFSHLPIQCINADRGQDLWPADVNGDGFVDLVALTQPGSIPNNPKPIQFRLWLGPFSPLAAGPFEDVTDLPQGTAVASDALRVGDLDGNGSPELCVRVPTGAVPGIYIYRRAAPGAPYTKGTPLNGRGSFALVDHDPVNGADGDLDVLEFAGGAVVLHEQMAPPLVFAPPVTLFTTGLASASIDVATDLDRDGFPDLLLHDSTLQQSQVWYGALGGAWIFGQTIGPDPSAPIGPGVALDVDKDGYDDLVLRMGTGNAVFLRIGPRIFEHDAKLESPMTPALPYLDVDGDGDSDTVFPLNTAIELHWGGR